MDSFESDWLINIYMDSFESDWLIIYTWIPFNIHGSTSSARQQKPNTNAKKASTSYRQRRTSEKKIFKDLLRPNHYLLVHHDAINKVRAISLANLIWNEDGLFDYDPSRFRDK